MKNVYFTAREGRRTANGHTITRGEVYVVRRGGCGRTTPHGADGLENVGEYVHQSGGADITRAVLDGLEKAGVDTGEGYYGAWRERVCLIQI